MAGQTITGYDPTKFNYLGNANPEVLVCLLRQDAPAKTLEDILSNELIIGATAPGSTTADFPMITKGLLGAKFRLVTGYQGSREVTLAVEKNEVQGACGFAWPSINVTNANWFGEQGFVRAGRLDDQAVFLEDAGVLPECRRLVFPVVDLAHHHLQRVIGLRGMAKDERRCERGQHLTRVLRHRPVVERQH